MVPSNWLLHKMERLWTRVKQLGMRRQHGRRWTHRRIPHQTHRYSPTEHQIGTSISTHLQRKGYGMTKRKTGIGWEAMMIPQRKLNCPSNRRAYHNSSQDTCLNKGVMLQFIHFLYLSTSYLIFGAYLILSIGSTTPQSHDIVTQSPLLTLWYFCFFLAMVHLLLNPLL